MYVHYSGGSTPGEVRAIIPLKWKSKPTSITVKCFHDESAPLEKTYFPAASIQTDVSKFAFE